MRRGVAFELLPLALSVAMIFIAPHVKVEESFNAQLMHDLIFGGGLSNAATVAASGTDGSTALDELFAGRSDGGLRSYDHHAFPGVVPRTTVGALVVAAIAGPFARAYDVLVEPPTRLHGLIMCRLILAFMFCGSLVYLARGLTVLHARAVRPRPKKGQAVVSEEAEAAARPPLSQAGTWLLVLASFCCFHLHYYGSRPLPNTFATVLLNVAGGLMMRGAHYGAIAILAAAASVFRSDIAVLGLPLCLAWVAFGYVNIFAGFFVGAASAVVAVLGSAAVDSVLWGSAVWPEGVVLYYNTVLNKSGSWGVMAWHWYFSNALPRAMLFALPLALVAVVCPTKNTRGPVIARRLGCVYLSFVALYSYLPHKELRFILVALPWLLSAAAVLAARLWTAPATWPLAVRALCRLGLLGGLTLSCMVSGVMLRSNSYEYVGARALAAAHGYLAGSPTSGGSAVFLDAFACMNGVTRFEKSVPRGATNIRVVTYSKDPTLFNRTAHEEAGTSPAAAASNFDVIVIREEDVNWMTAALQKAPSGPKASIVAHVPKLALSLRRPRGLKELLGVLTAPMSIIDKTPLPFLTVMTVSKTTGKP